MKFAEFPYERPDLSGGYGAAGCAFPPITSATTAEEAKNAFLSFEKKSQSGSGASLPSAISAIR